MSCLGIRKTHVPVFTSDFNEGYREVNEILCTQSVDINTRLSILTVSLRKYDNITGSIKVVSKGRTYETAFF